MLLAPVPDRHRLERVLSAERRLLRRRVGVDEDEEGGVQLGDGRRGGGVHDRGEPVDQLDTLGVELVLRDLRDQVVARNEQAVALAVVALLRLLLVAADLVLLLGGVGDLARAGAFATLVLRHVHPFRRVLNPPMRYSVIILA